MIGRALSVQAQQRSSSPRLASLREQLLQDVGEEKQSSWMDSVAVAEPVKSKRVQKAHVRHPDWLRVQRPVPEHKLWARVTHVRTKKPLSAFLPEEPPSDDEPEAPPKKKREAPRKKKEDPPKQVEAAPKKEEKKQEEPAEDEDEGTPLSDYWLGDAVGSSSKNPGPGAARVWDDGFFTDDEHADGFEVEGDEPALGAGGASRPSVLFWPMVSIAFVQKTQWRSPSRSPTLSHECVIAFSLPDTNRASCFWTNSFHASTKISLKTERFILSAHSAGVFAR